MPIRPENRVLYPPNWRQVSQDVRKRAGNQCEDCGLRNYSVGYRDAQGIFVHLCGSGPCDAAGDGRAWPSLEPIAYQEAREFAEASNSCGKRDDEGNRWFVIVLTVAHLDHNPRNCDPTNLKALCQRCHLRYDQQHHSETSATTRRSGKAIADLFQQESSK